MPARQPNAASEDDGPAPSTSLSTSPRAIPARNDGVFAFLVATATLLDLLTKSWVFAWRGLPGRQPVWWLWEGYIGIETSLNTGALFGLGQNKVLWLAAFSALALVVLLAGFFTTDVARDRSMTIVLAFIAAGIIGNLYDRLGIWSFGWEDAPVRFAVRDWIRLSVQRHVWPNFNLADSYLVCSAIYLVWQSMRSPPAESKGPTKEPQ
jgi:signal peptidase II